MMFIDGKLQHYIAYEFYPLLDCSILYLMILSILIFTLESISNTVASFQKHNKLFSTSSIRIKG